MADIEINLESSNPKELIAHAVRAYAIGDFTNAAAAFGRATQLMAQEFGDENDSLGEIYIQYAKALLELSREENLPFGDAIPHGETDSDSEEAAEVEKANDVPENDDDKKVENGEDVKNGEPKPDDNNEETETKTEKEDEEPEPAVEEICSDLQLAWEVLEVAKKIFSTRGDAGKERLAETMILLGEIGMESENFTDGINDMKEGIELQKTLFEPTSRKLAESYYKLGTAQFTISNIVEAVESFQASIKTLKNRIDLLQSDSDEGKTEKEIKAKNDEIEEMKSLIPEIEEKINDTKTVKEEMTAQILQEMAGNKTNADEKEAASTSSKPNDISHLVKRKRKADEEPAEVTAKKPTP